ncbi:F-box and leucine-rich repeat protein 13 isoform 4-T4 [Anableps anableps]
MWKSIIQTGALWSKINFSLRIDWITDSIVQQILMSYRPFVTHLNLRGCPLLEWPSLKYISECRNLQELNMSECLTVSDMMIQKITEGCPCLLYLNLSFTLITNHTLKSIFRNCFSLQYLSLAHCRKFTDEGFLYLTTEKGGRNLIHLDLSGCTQMTVNGFRYISAGCPSLSQLVINDMPTLSDSCVLSLVTRCHSLSSISLLGCSQLSDVALKAIAETANLKTFRIEGNNQITDVSWEALCSSCQNLCRLHIPDCLGMTDDSLSYVAILRNLQYLDISLCIRVTDAGIKHLTDGSSVHTLHDLSISKCCLITDISVKRIARRLHKLYHLNLSYCESLTDLAMEWLSGTSIRSLDISGCNIQDQGLAALQKTQLKKIVLAECVNITDIGLEMTDMAVMYLTSGSKYLRELDMSECVLLTDSCLRHLRRICPPLTSIRMTCCSNISWAAATKLQKYVSHWEYSNDDPPSWFDCSANKLAMNPMADTWTEENEHSKNL